MDARARTILLESGVRESDENLLQLLDLPPEHQRDVACQRRLGVSWEDAIRRFLVRVDVIAGPVGAVVEVDIRCLKPNEINETIFSDSLSANGLATLIEDCRRNGLRVPIEVLRDGVIVEGERR